MIWAATSTTAARAVAMATTTQKAAAAASAATASATAAAAALTESAGRLARDAGAAGGSLARRLNARLGAAAGPPADLLAADGLEPHFVAALGFPESADALAYDASQGLLAIGAADGRVLLVGRPGVEAALRSPSRAPTRFLAFLRHRGALLRVGEDGSAQLWSAASRRLLAALPPRVDAATAVAVVPGGPYVLLGGASGDVAVLSVPGRAGRDPDAAAADAAAWAASPAPAGPPAPPAAAAGLALAPYRILAEDLDASGAVVALAVARAGDRPLLLAVHAGSGALVWDLRAQRVLCAAPDDPADPSRPTAACWVGEGAAAFAVGYDDGSVLVWGVPPRAAAVAAAPAGAAAEDCLLVLSLRAAPDGAAAAPARALAFLAGGPGTPRGEDCLLVCGGQPAGDPDALALLPLDPRAPASAARAVPWFGDVRAHTLMNGPDGGGAPDALAVLTAGGQLVVHSLAEWMPNPLALPLQELPPISATAYLPALGAAAAAALGGAGEVQHAVTLAAVRAAYARHGAAAVSADAADAPGAWGGDRGAWPFGGGAPAPPAPGPVGAGARPAALILTGHRDGRVRVWDATRAAPRLLGAVPAAAAAAGERLRGVTALVACPFSGLLAVGHAGGDVRVYQFADRPQAARRAALDESLVPYDAALAQPAGWQYVLRYGCHAADATALALPTRLRALAVGDAAGGVSVVDLAAPARLWRSCAPGGGGVAALAAGLARRPAAARAPPPAPDSGCAAADTAPPGLEERAEEEPEDAMALFALSDDGALQALALADGAPAGRPLRPKHAARALALALLDAHGVPLPPLQGPCLLPWADNNAAAAPRSAAMMKLGAGSGGGRRRAGASLDVRVLPSSEDDSELDTRLAAAAKAAAPSGARGSFFRRRVPSRAKEAAAEERGAFAAASASEDEEDEELDDEAEEEEVELGGKGGAGASPPPADADGEVYPLSADGVPGAVSFVLLADADALRLYPAAAALAGDRAAARKVRLDPPAAFAAAFASRRGPGLATVSAAGALAVHSVPGLEPLLAAPLEAPEVLGFPWREPPAGARPPWVLSLDGELLLTAEGNEVARLALAKGAPLPAPPAATYDWAAARAGAAEAAAAAPRAPPATPPGSSQLGAAAGAAAARGRAMLAAARGSAAAAPRELPTLRALFSTPVESLTAEDGGDGATAVGEAGEAPAEVPAASAPSPGAAVAAAAGAAAERAKGAALAGAALAGGALAGGAAHLRGLLARASSDDAAPGEAPPGAGARARSARLELLGASPSPGPRARAASGAPGQPRFHRRTASEVKRTYAPTAGHSRAQDARAVAEKNRALLAERGQKLANLEERSAVMAGDAEDFASMAQELEARFAGRKWWQL